MSASPVPRRWSTDEVPVRHRLDYWVGAISEGFLAMDAGGQRDGFHSELHSAPLGCLGVNWVHGAAQQVWRTPRGIARSHSQQFCYLLGNTASTWTVAQDGREALMRPGDFVLVDSRRPYRFGFDQGPSTVSLELPLDWVTRWVAAPETQTARPFRHDTQDWAAALSSLARMWRPELALAPPLPAQLLEDQLGALLALACEPQSDPRTTGATDLADLARELIRQRLAEPGLTASEVAHGLGCSVRSLHRAMARRQTTFAQVLIGERMAIAGQMLANPTLRQVSAAEIGRRVGLIDPSHFGRLCRRWFGATPSALRRN